jgi:hypothetical protein
MGTETPQPGQPESGPPVFAETMGGAVIDAARISTMAAMHLIPEAPESAILLPSSAEEASDSIHGCLEQALMWLNQARQLSVEQQPAPPTSLHIITRPGG